MVTTVCQSIFSALHPKPKLLSITHSSIPYVGYAILDICLADSSIFVSAPVLVVPDTKYSESIPLIIGTNVIRYFKGQVDKDISAPWQEAFSAIRDVQNVPVKSFSNKTVVIRPFETRTVTGYVRGTGSMV